MTLAKYTILQSLQILLLFHPKASLMQLIFYQQNDALSLDGFI